MIFEKASRLRLRFNTREGVLATEDLWDLNLSQLNTLAKSLNKEIKEMEEEDFLEEKSSKDIKTQLKFDIVKKILDTKKEELKKREEASLRKERKEELLAARKRKQDESTDNMSLEEIDKELAELEG